MPPGDALTGAFLAGAWLGSGLLPTSAGVTSGIELVGRTEAGAAKKTPGRVPARLRMADHDARELPEVGPLSAAPEQSSPASPGGATLWAGAPASADWAHELDPLSRLDLGAPQLGTNRGSLLRGTDAPRPDSPDGVPNTASAARSPVLDFGSNPGAGAPTARG